MFLTLNNIKKLSERLKKLKNIDIPKIINEINLSKKNGDFSENSDYQYSKKKKSLIEKEIRDIEFKISNSQITNKKNEFSLIILKDLKNNKKIRFEINDFNEEQNNNSNILYLLKDKKIGDKIEIKKYNKTRFFEIILLK